MMREFERFAIMDGNRISLHGEAERAETWLRTALTEAHQAGRDEAVEEAIAREKQLRDIHKIQLDTISCMSLEGFVVWSDHRKKPKDDTSKALQDNK